MTRDDIAALRQVSVSQGIMLESAAERLGRRGGPHFGSPDKDPALRLETIRAAGEAAVPFTTGILIGIGETRRERIESLLALRDLHDRHGHVQEIIIQNFRAKPGTRMAQAPEPDLDDHLWTIAVARLIFGTEMNIQAPPNLNPGALAEMIAAGINDWGGVSPVTPDHVNPERPWPALDRLAEQTAAAGKLLVERLAIYPRFSQKPATAREAFAESGYGVPLDEIAARAGVGPGTVYRHFPAKEALFESVVAARVADQVRVARARAGAAAPGEALFGFLGGPSGEGAAQRHLPDALLSPAGLV